MTLVAVELVGVESTECLDLMKGKYGVSGLAVLLAQVLQIEIAITHPPQRASRGQQGHRV